MLFHADNDTDSLVSGRICRRSIPFSVVHTVIIQDTSQKWKVCNFDLDMAHLFEKERRCHELTIEAYGHVLLQVSLDRISTWRAHLISNIIAAASCLNIRPSYRWTSLYHYHQLRLPSHQSRYNSTHTRTPWRWIRRRCSGRDHFPGVKQGLDVCRRGGMAKRSRLVSFLYIYIFLKIFFHVHFYPDHFADHPLEDIIEKIACQLTTRHILLFGTQVGRSTSATPDKMIEVRSSSGSRTGIPASLKK